MHGVTGRGKRLGCWFAWAALLLVSSDAAVAQADRDALERIEQARTARQQRDAAAMAPMAGTGPAGRAWLPPLEGEAPCFPIHHFQWDAQGDAPPFGMVRLLEALEGYEGACLGAGSLDRLRQNLDQRLLDAGYVTSRVTLPPQQLTEAVLTLRLHLGRVGRIVHQRPDGQALAVPTGWLPVRPGEVLNLRRVEQGLENAARLPSLAAQVAIEPGDAEGFSNLVIRHAAHLPWRLQATVDNEALGDFGRWQASLAGSWDLGWLGADQISFWHHRSAAGLSPARLQQRSGLSYATAWGASLLSLSLSDGGHRRVIQGTTLQFSEASHDRGLNLQVQQVVWRGGQGRLSTHIGVGMREARTFIEDTELLLQRRRSRHLSWGLAAQVRGERWLADVQVSRQRVLANDPRVDLLPEAPPKPRLDAVSLSVQRGFAAWPLAYSGALDLGWVRDPAYGSDLQALGGPGSVRGFTGAAQVVGLRSVVLRQDLVWSPAWAQQPAHRHQGTLGLDLGQVGQPDPAAATPGRDRRLVGVSISLRSQFPAWGVGSTLSWSRPILQPPAWPARSSRWTLQLTSQY